MLKKNHSTKFAHWLLTPAGLQFGKIEKQILAALPLQEINSSNTAVLGVCPYAALFDFSPLVLTDHLLKPTDGVVEADLSALPLPPDSMSHIVLPHTLDFSNQTSAILREVNIALKPGGDLIIFGLNPWSLWGVRRFFSLRKSAPWCGHFRSMWMIKDRLALLNYDIVLTQRFLYRPPLLKLNLFERLAKFEKYFRYFFPFGGAVYVIVAKKKVFGITPLRPKWKAIQQVLGSTVMKPVIKESHAENS